MDASVITMGMFLARQLTRPVLHTRRLGSIIAATVKDAILAGALKAVS